MAIKSDVTKHGDTRVQWGTTLLVNLAPLTYGLQLGWVSPMSKLLQSVDSPVGRPLTDVEISMIAGVPSLAAVIGIFISLYVVDVFGRKRASIVIAVFQLLCWIIKLCPTSYASLLMARISCGLGAGGCFHAIPMYIKEISQDNIRGTLGSIGSFCQYVGVLAMYSLGSFLDYNIVLYIVVGIPIFNIISLQKVPESPSFLVKTGKYEEAAENVAFLRGLNVNDKEVMLEIESIKKEDDYFKSIPNLTFVKIFEDQAWRRGFLIMLLIFICNGLNGVFFITNYASNLLADTDIDFNPDLQTLAIPVFLMTGTIFAMIFVDRLGRKLLLTATFIISSLAFFCLATTMLVTVYGYNLPGWLPVIVIIMTLCSYGAGISLVPVIIASEMFNFQIRAKLIGCLSGLSWFVSFVQITAFSAITSYLGGHVSFYIFSGINFIGAVIAVTILPETTGKSVSQIENDLTKGK